ncbi:MAG: DMT family transporter [Rhizobiales bacterium]|nr:DMT family transporter [Hyphomicrobiales bacterium]
MNLRQIQLSRSATLIGMLCGIGAALCWAAGFVVAKHGIAIGITPADLAFHRFAWTGLILTALLAREGLSNLGGIGWMRGFVMAVLAGPAQAFMAYTGFTLVPLGHGVVIQPACAALFGLVLAGLILHEHIGLVRAFGAAMIIAGLIVFGAEAVTTIGSHGLGGDLLFAGAGIFWAAFGTMLRYYSIAGTRAAMVVGTVALLVFVPLHAVLFGYDGMLQISWIENLLQIVVQGGLAGVLPIYLFARAIVLLGAGRAATFPALVPMFGMALGFALLGEIPSLMQLAGLIVVVVGFRFSLRS